jgi:hypothetical protein
MYYLYIGTRGPNKTQRGELSVEEKMKELEAMARWILMRVTCLLGIGFPSVMLMPRVMTAVELGVHADSATPFLLGLLFAASFGAFVGGCRVIASIGAFLFCAGHLLTVVLAPGLAG